MALGSRGLSDGLAEEIINLLAKIPGLRVIARTSAFAFKGKHEDVRKIALALSRRRRVYRRACRDGVVITAMLQATSIRGLPKPLTLTPCRVRFVEE
jgi:TolB-like protein